MGRLVDADLLKEKAVKFSFSTNKWVSDVDIDLMPTVDAVPVVHGYWKDSIECSECEQIDWTNPNYCPNCGAKMDLERSKDV